LQPRSTAAIKVPRSQSPSPPLVALWALELMVHLGYPQLIPQLGCYFTRPRSELTRAGTASFLLPCGSNLQLARYFACPYARSASLSALLSCLPVAAFSNLDDAAQTSHHPKHPAGPPQAPTRPGHPLLARFCTSALCVSGSSLFPQTGDGPLGLCRYGTCVYINLREWMG